MDPALIDPNLVFAKTPAGEEAMMQRSLVAQRNLRMVLILVDGNATQAAIRAGYSQRGADVQGVRLLGDARIQQAVYEAQQARAQRVQIDQDWVLRRLKEEAEYRDQGATHAARVRALELCGKHLGMFREDNNQRNPLSDLPRDMIKDLVAKLGGTTP